MKYGKIKNSTLLKSHIVQGVSKSVLKKIRTFFLVQSALMQCDNRRDETQPIHFRLKLTAQQSKFRCIVDETFKSV